jgi:hypothetical protein
VSVIAHVIWDSDDGLLDRKRVEELLGEFVDSDAVSSSPGQYYLHLMYRVRGYPWEIRSRVRTLREELSIRVWTEWESEALWSAIEWLEQHNFSKLREVLESLPARIGDAICGPGE